MKTKLILFGAILAANFGTAQDWSRAGGSFGFGSSRLPTAEEKAKQKQEIKTKAAHGHFIREVNGKLYNVQTNALWQAITSKVYQKDGEVLILENEQGGYSGLRTSWSYLAVKNYSGEAIDQHYINFVAMKVGTYDMGGRPIELWDCGKPYVPPPPTPEQIKAAQEAAKIAAQREKQKVLEGQTNAVHWLQSQATNGDASAQCRLALHYLNGQGCETNREQAIYWLQKAAAQGDSEASKKLSELKSL